MASTKQKTIFRVIKSKDNPFVMIDRRPLEKPYMSWKAKGLLAYLLSRPDDWVVRLGDLVKRSTDKGHATRQALRELVLVGHAKPVEYRTQGGTFAGMIYEIHEQPLYDKPQAVYPHAEKRILNNTDLTYTDPPTTGAPNIFVEYEANIGPLTPIIADTLQDAEKTYPPAWITDAIRLAVMNNKRNWKYCEAILRRWQADGKDDGKRPERTKGNGKVLTGSDALDRYGEREGYGV